MDQRLAEQRQRQTLPPLLLPLFLLQRDRNAADSPREDFWSLPPLFVGSGPSLNDAAEGQGNRQCKDTSLYLLVVAMPLLLQVEGSDGVQCFRLLESS